MKVLTAESMREVDRRAIEEIGIPSMVLMENAAQGVVEAVGDGFPEAAEALILCGPGNNGGDGFAVGRLLAVRGYRVLLVQVTGGREPGGDAGAQLEICRRMGLPIWELEEIEELEPVLAAARDADLVVDALFGTGLKRPLEGLYADLVTGLNRLAVPRLAVDLPSGLSGSEAGIPGPHLRAHQTVTFAAPKLAHLLPPAAEAVGELAVADLGIPPQLLEEADGFELLEDDAVASWLPPRRPGGHKGTYGHVLLVAGGPGRAGAAILAARGAVRCGAGLVTAAVPAGIRDAVDLGSLESMTLPLACGPDGELIEAAADAVALAAEGKTVLALGPGLGSGEEVGATLRRMVMECPLPVVLDADGLNAFAGRLEELSQRRAATILTPHPGEMGRLLEIGTDLVQADRLAAARAAASRSGAVVVLKGQWSCVAEPGGEIWLNPTGNPGMATGGSGDVLTGMIAALRAQGLAEIQAAAAGTYLHGLAGDLAAARLGQTALAAGDLLDTLPTALRRLESP